MAETENYIQLLQPDQHQILDTTTSELVNNAIKDLKDCGESLRRKSNPIHHKLFKIICSLWCFNTSERQTPGASVAKPTTERKKNCISATKTEKSSAKRAETRSHPKIPKNSSTAAKEATKETAIATTLQRKSISSQKTTAASSSTPA